MIPPENRKLGLEDKYERGCTTWGQKTCILGKRRPRNESDKKNAKIQISPSDCFLTFSVPLRKMPGRSALPSPQHAK